MAYLDWYLAHHEQEALSRRVPHAPAPTFNWLPPARPARLLQPAIVPLRPSTDARRFQLLGLACLRAAMGDARRPAALGGDADKKLDPQNFAYISDDTYTAEEVEAQTKVPPAARSCLFAARSRSGSLAGRTCH